MTTEQTYEATPGRVFAQAKPDGLYHLAEPCNVTSTQVTYKGECNSSLEPFVPTDVKTKYQKLPGKDICRDCAKAKKWLLD